MNLATDGWIPVVWDDGRADRVSLAALFEHAERLRDLAAPPPHRIALLRLLVCLAQAGLDGPQDEDDWLGCRERIQPAARQYLQQWENAFELRGERPFLQIPDLEVDEGKSQPVDALDDRLATGNNMTLFDHEARPDGRAIPDADLALLLLTFLNFAHGGKIGQAKWKGERFSHSTFATPCLGSLHIFVRGQNLLDTLHLNLMTKELIESLPQREWGRPVWEQFPQGPDDADAFHNALNTYLGRLAPLSRLVRLLDADSNQCIIGPLPPAHKPKWLPEFREPWCAILSGADRYLKVDHTKHIWREVGGMLSLEHTSSGLAGSLAIENVRRLSAELPDGEIDLWAGGVEPGGGGGKIVDAVEWSAAAPISMLGEQALTKYAQGVALCEDGEKKLVNAVKEFFKQMMVQNIPAGPTRQLYWSRLDREHPRLFDAAVDEKADLDECWIPIVWKAMTDTFEDICPRQTPRQIQTFAAAQRKLKPPKV